MTVVERKGTYLGADFLELDIKVVRVVNAIYHD